MRDDTKKYLPFPLFLLSLVVVGGGMWYVLRITNTPIPEPININEVTLAGSVELEASPAPASQILNQEFTLDINAHSGVDLLQSVQLDLVYDATKFQVVSFVKTDYLPIYLTTPAITSDRITGNFGLPPDSPGKSDWGTIAQLTLKPLALGTQTINFGDDTIATSSAFPLNALKKVTPIAISVFNLGDINRDKVVNLLDYNLFVAEFGKSGYSMADLDKSGQVNLIDFALFTTNYGLTSP